MSSADRASPKESFSGAEARRIALAAQGFAAARPRRTVTHGDVERVFDRLHLVQLDSVNVAVRTHYMPFFSRLGAYERSLVDTDAYARKTVFEYWAHEACLVPMDQYPLFHHRMVGEGHKRHLGRFLTQHPGYADRVLAEVRERGPLAVKDLEEAGERTGPWWGYGKGKIALEYHFAAGAVAVASRRNFARQYDLAERVIPEAIRALPPLAPEDAHREMVRRAGLALGVAIEADIADYYRIKPAEARPRIAELVDAGELLPVKVEGWTKPAYLHRDAAVPRRVQARALLSPFDSLVWRRERTERVFDFHYRIEIYTPAEKRVFGYYVMPFLLGDQIVARVDLKADRANGRLLVRGAFLEPGAEGGAVAPELRAELEGMASWLGLDQVVVEPNGDLAGALSDVPAPGG